MNSASLWKKPQGLACVVILCSTLALAADTPSTSTKTKTSGAPTTTTKNSATTRKSSTRRHKKSRRASWRRGQQKVDPARAREIQQALIRERYLKGTPSGQWDDATQSAMKRYQAANGWQTKTVPDARALIKLGLGPSHDHLLNPESAMTGAPQPHSSNSVPADSNRTPAPQ